MCGKLLHILVLILRETFGYVLCVHSVKGGKKRWKEKNGNMRNNVVKTHLNTND